MPPDDCRGIMLCIWVGESCSDRLCSPPHPRLSFTLQLLFTEMLSLIQWPRSASQYYQYYDPPWNTLVLITFLMTMSPFFVVNFPILTAEDWGNWSARAARAAGLAAAPSSAALTISVKLRSNTEIRGKWRRNPQKCKKMFVLHKI